MSGPVMEKPSDTISRDVGAPADDLHHLTAAQLRHLGVALVVYLRPCMVDGELAYAVLGADGALMSVVEDMGTAEKLAFDHGMSVVTVH